MTAADRQAGSEPAPILSQPSIEAEFDPEYPESWVPWKDDGQPRTLVGDVREYTLGPDLGFGRSHICTVTDRDGKLWSIWLSQTVLLGQFEEHRPMPGERIVLRYLGKEDEPRGGGPQYHRFRLTVEREPQLPEFLTRPQLERRIEEPQPPSSVGGLPPGDVNHVTEAEVVEERDFLEGGENVEDVTW